MKNYRTDAALLDGYSKEHGEPDNIYANMISKYHPHIYKGGKVIPGFGYSTQRIESGHVSNEKCGSPEGVK